MEENGGFWELNSVSVTTGYVFIETMISLCVKTSSQYLSSISSSPLFSTIITLYTLIFLYFPHRLFLRILLSPVLILTGLLLLTLLRLGATQKHDNHDDNDQNQLTTAVEIISDESKDQFMSSNELYDKLVDTEESEIEMGSDPNPCYEEYFLYWNVRAPLEVIYEEYEGEDRTEKDPRSNEVVEIERHPSLSLYYPESDSDSSSEGVFPSTGDWDLRENLCFSWEEDQDYREGLIEIALDGNKTALDFHGEEDNLIEIDISPTRNDEFLRKKWHFPDEVKCIN